MPDDTQKPRPVVAFARYVDPARLVILDQDDIDRIRHHRFPASLRQILVEALDWYLGSRREAYREVCGEEIPDDRRYHGEDSLYVLIDKNLTTIDLERDLLDELYALTPEPREQEILGWSTAFNRALAAYAEHLDARAAPGIPGSTSPPVRRWVPPAGIDPVPAAEALAAVRGWLQRGRRT